jgi:MarR family transcriptional regulator, transcriptional regulator for hemolysin
MPHSVDPDSFGFLIADVSRLIRAEFDRLISAAGIGLTPAEARMLIHLARTGEVRQNVLADRMGIEAMTTSGYLDRLEPRGLVARRPDPSDRRAKLVALTDACDPVIERIRAIAASIRLRATHSMTEEERQSLKRLLIGVRDELSAARTEAGRAA